MDQRGQSTVEYLALLTLLCALLAVAILTAGARRLGPVVIARIEAAIVGDDGSAAPARAVALARAALAGDERGSASTSDALILLRSALGREQGDSVFDAMVLSVVRARRPDLFAARSYVLLPALSPDELRDERRGVLLRIAPARGDDRSVETTSEDGASRVRLLTQADEARGLLVAAGDRDAARRQKEWLRALGPLAIAGVAALAPEAAAGGAIAGPEAVAAAGKGALEASAVADLIDRVRSGQRAVYPPATRRGDLVVCLPVLRINRSGEPPRSRGSPTRTGCRPAGPWRPRSRSGTASSFVRAWSSTRR